MPRVILQRAFVFLLPVLLLLLGLEWLQRELPHNVRRKKHNLEAGLSQWKTLVMGSSHTYLGVNPDSLDGPAYNMAHTAQTLSFDRYLLERYLDQMPGLETVILPISYSSLNTESYLNKGKFDQSYNYHFFYGREDFVNWYSPKYYSLVAILTIKESVDRASEFYFLGDSLITFEPNGWRNMPQQKDLKQSGKTAALYHDNFYFPELREENKAHLAAIISACKARGIDLYLISTPMWRSYMEHIQPERYQYMVHTVDSISSVHGIPYWNFTNDDRFGKEDFFDSNHLRTEGANKFSPILRRKIRQYKAGARD